MESERRQPKLIDETAKVVVLGDPDVGKTSLIIAATESFDPSPPACLPPTRLPPTFDNTPLLAIDTSTRSENRLSLETVLQGVDVILLCYAVDMIESIRHIRSFWLPEMRRLKSNVPIVLCGCRMDMAPDEQAFESQRLFLQELLKEYREVEAAIECSARSMQHVQEVFYFALNAVRHPQFPLYDTINQRLKPRCSQALKRIFLLCDRDRDGRLDEEELNEFQVKCFESPLQPEELLGVFETVQNKLETGVQGNGLTVAGFQFLHALFMERGTYETTWTSMRKFGYTNELTLSDELLDAVPFDHAPDQVLQLSEKAIDFLTEWFLNLDEDQSKTVPEAKIHALMEETTPERIWTGRHWERLFVSAAPMGHVTLQGFLSKWHYSMMTEPKTCLKQLLYMGWSNEMVQSMYSLSRHRRQERRESSSRSVIQCWLFGADGCGKTSLLRGLVGPADHQRDAYDKKEGYVAVDIVPLLHGSKTMMLTEISPGKAQELLSKAMESPSQQTLFAEADIAVFLYAADDRNSFVEARNTMLSVSEAAGDHLPCQLICTKTDRDIAFGLEDSVAQLSEELKLRPPLKVAVTKGELHDVYSTLLQTAMKPTIDTIPETPARKSQRLRRLWTGRLLIAGGVVSAVTLLTLYVYPRWTQRGSEEIEVNVLKR